MPDLPPDLDPAAGVAFGVIISLVFWACLILL